MGLPLVEVVLEWGGVVDLGESKTGSVPGIFLLSSILFLFSLSLTKIHAGSCPFFSSIAPCIGIGTNGTDHGLLRQLTCLGLTVDMSLPTQGRPRPHNFRKFEKF
jgi:hypothetical protein